MSNEMLLALAAVADIVCVFIAARLGREWLFASIVANFILVALLGTILVSVFGFTTNAANVFYACIFYATYFLVWRYKTGALEVIGLGVGTAVFFSLMVHLSLQLTPAAFSELGDTLRQSLTFIPRIFFASMVAYIFAQQVNVNIFSRLQAVRMPLWLCALGASAVAQGVDSALFFTIAFFDLSGPLLLQSILSGWAIKVAVVGLGSPLLAWEQQLAR